MLNCLTVDVEEWFHICNAGPLLDADHWDSLPSRVVSTTRDLLDVFDRAGARATFFVLGWIADRHPTLVREIMAAGHEVASHGYWHQRVYELSPARFADDIVSSRRAMAAAGAPDVRGYRAPEWSINGRSLWALDLLAEHGFTFDSSMAPLRIVGDPHYPQRPHTRATARGDIREFPPLVDRRLGQNMPMFGWGLRMTRPARVLQIIERQNTRGIPVAIALHPWEIDPEPPRVALPVSLRFAHYAWLNGFCARLESVLRHATFAPMSAALGLESN